MLDCFQMLKMICQILVVLVNLFQWTYKHSAPVSRISLAVFSPSASRLPENTTFAPAAPKAITSLSFPSERYANANAVVRPIPEVSPVTNATLSCSIILFLLFQFRQFGLGKFVSATQ